MRILTRKGEQVLHKLEILAFGDQHLVDQALSCNVIGRQRTLSDVVDYILCHRQTPTDPALQELWWQAAKAALAAERPVRRGWRLGHR
jgi:hypothetical protein